MAWNVLTLAIRSYTILLSYIMCSKSWIMVEPIDVHIIMASVDSGQIGLTTISSVARRS